MKNERWPWSPIGDLFQIGAGKTMSAAARNGSRKTPFLRTSNVLWDEIDLATVDEMVISPIELAEKSLQAGDLLVCEGGEIGRAAIWTGEVKTMSFQNHLHRLRPIVDGVEPRFYLYFLQSAFTQLGLFEGAGNKTTIPNLSRNRLAALEVPRPPLEEQRAVAAALSHVRAALQLHDRAAKLAVELKDAAMQHLLTRGLRGEPQKDSDLGPIPRSWDIAKLGDICSLSTGTTPSTSRADYYAGDVPFIKTADIVNNRITEANTHISDQAVEDYGLKLFPPGTVLMAMYGQGKTRGQASLLEIAAATTQNAAAIQASEEIEPAFLWHYLRANYARLRGIGSLGHLSHLNLGYLRELSVLKPPLDDQKEIAAMLDLLNQKIDLHKEKRVTLEQLFQVLLQQLMTGVLRPADLDLDTVRAEAS
ncbi:MAG TPA: restriction endonuclease subunit S [Polyangiaceae bacterium]|nr:restriction endonuclease subunit S [Polyangiaceae bacterium]